MILHLCPHFTEKSKEPALRVACIVSASAHDEAVVPSQSNTVEEAEGGRPPLGDRFQHHMLTSAVELLSHQLLTYDLRIQMHTHKPHL